MIYGIDANLLMDFGPIHNSDIKTINNLIQNNIFTPTKN
jgi:hypothetical protein